MSGIRKLAAAIKAKGLDKLAGHVASVVPGGPLATAIVGTVASALGAPDQGPDYLAEAVAKASPAQLVPLLELEASIEIAKLQDTQHARETFGNKTSWAQIVICAFVGIMVSILTVAMLKVTIPDGNRDIVVFIAGQVTGWFGAIVTYHFGSSAGSARKTEMIGK